MTKDFYNGDLLVHKLEDSNWEKRTAKGNWLINFYAPWCTHCLKATKRWRQVADDLDGEFEVGAINAETNPKVLT